jgi:hypothetical protein
VLSFENELSQLRTTLGDRVTDLLIARERREVFSIYPELRIAGWAGAMLVATAAGIVLKNNLDRIGPLALAVLIGLAAAACYAWVWWHRARASLVDDFVLLLGALLLSADAGFVETQFHVLGDDWHRHFLLLAIVHGVAAYAYRSRMVLSLSITALAAWLGIEQRSLGVYDDPTSYAIRATICAALLLAWRFANRIEDFAPIFEHFAANLLLSAGIGLMFDDDLRIAASLGTIVVAALVIVWGFRTRRESFVLYAFVYAVIALDVLLVEAIGTSAEELLLLLIVLSTIGAIVSLIFIHSRFKEIRA